MRRNKFLPLSRGRQVTLEENQTNTINTANWQIRTSQKRYFLEFGQNNGKKNRRKEGASMRNINRPRTVSWESLATERGSLQEPHLVRRRIVLKRTFREKARGGERGKRQAEQEGRRKNLVPRKYFSRVKASGSATARHTASRHSTSGHVSSACNTRQRSSPRDRDDLNFRLIYHGMRGGPIKNFLLEGKIQPIVLRLFHYSASSLCIFHCFHPETAAERFYDVINDTRGSGKPNMYFFDK